MRNWLYIIFLICLMGCDTENAPDCFQRTGDILQREVLVEDFTRILVNPNVEMVLKQGEKTSVVIETGDNLIDEVTARVEGDRLILENTNDCNFVRGFNQTKIFVTAPEITEIRSATQFDISSDGVLSYNELSLFSEDFFEDAGYATGIFNLTISSERITVVGNNIASFLIHGKTENLKITFASGTGRFEGADLISQNVQVFHRGSNKIIINPQSSIKGEIRSTGDVICVNKPDIIEVEEFFTGRLIFQ